MFARPQVESTRARMCRLGLVITLALGACAPSRSDLVGTWKVDYPAGVAILKLNEDGSFSQDVRIRDEEGAEHAASRTGKWTYTTDKAAAIVLMDCLSPLDISGRVESGFERKHGNCYLPVEREWAISGRLRLGSTEADVYRRTE